MTAPGAGSVDRNAPAGRIATLIGVCASSASVLMLEVVLSRVFAVTQFYHFAFLTVSLALLGFGASGSALTVFPRLGRGGPGRWAALAAVQSGTTLAGYGAANLIPFDSFSIAWDPIQLLYLGGLYLSLSVPFFFGGAVIGTLLAGWDQPHPVPSHQVYGASLAGSGMGALLVLGALGRLGGVGVVGAAAAVAAAGAVAFAAARPVRARLLTAATVALTLATGLVALFPPGILDLRLSPYKSLSAVMRFPDADLISTRWNAASRVDHVGSSSIRSLPGLSYTYTGEVPAQHGVTFDGDDLSPIPLMAPEDAEFAPYLLVSLPFTLRSGGDALVLEPRGGLDVLVALAAGAATVTAVEPNGLALAAAREADAAVYDDPRVRVVGAEPRSFAERSDEQYDVVDVALTAPYRPVTSGAYSLAEEYGLTVEAFDAYLERLAPGGILAALRWVQLPPSEETRLIALAARAASRSGADPVDAVVALRGYSTALVLVKPDGFDEDEIEAISSFAEQRRFDLIAAPGLTAAQANRFNVLPADGYYPLAAAVIGAGGAVPAGYPFDVTPPTDDRPFFGHYFTWDQASEVLDTLGRTWQPFGGAGYFVLIVLLVLAGVAAVVLIVLPVPFVGGRRTAGRSASRRGHRLWTVGYFGLLGVAFLFVEIPLIQRYILLLGRPTTALAVVLFALLAASGAGSMLSRRVPWRAGAAVLAVAAAGYPWLVSVLTGSILSMPLPVRISIGALVLAPLGFLMGIMYPRGLARLEEVSPGLVPWAWAVNGTMSVVSAVAAALFALNAGFTAVVLTGAACYGACVPLARPGVVTPG